MKYTTRIWLGLLLPLGLAAGVAAAPTTDAPGAEPETSAHRNSGLPEMTGVSEGHGNSKTVRMLLELQNTPPPLEGTADARRNDNKPKIAAPRAGAELISAGAVTAPVPQTNSVDWRSGLPGRTVNSQRSDATTTVATREAQAANPAPRQMADDQVDVKAMLPARVVAFLRENREWVLASSLGLLVVVWLGAATLTQRRR